jgi:hypothetical protein
MMTQQVKEAIPNGRTYTFRITCRLPVLCTSYEG